MKPKHSTNMDRSERPEKSGGDLAKHRQPVPGKLSPAPVPLPPQKAKDSFDLKVKKGEDPDQQKSDLMLGEFIAPVFATLKYAEGTIGKVSLENAMHSMISSAERVTTGNNLAMVEAMLVTQAYSLNLLYSECVRRSALNLGEYPEASHRYFTMALKAQNQSRMTLETLSNIKNPPIVYARQANIANGPQQVNNGTQPRAHAEENQTQPNKLL